LAQCDLFQEFVQMAWAPEETGLLKKTLAGIVGIYEDLTGTDSGSLEQMRPSTSVYTVVCEMNPSTLLPVTPHIFGTAFK
jgi:hypothetical protein